jgi:S1-C subfamily serine protease
VTRRRALAVGAFAAAVVALVLALALRGGDAAGDPPIVRVELEDPTGSAQVATGFGVAPGRVVTVAHVLEPGHPLVVRSRDGRPHRARVLRVDRRDDLALIAVPGLAAPTLGGAAADGDRLLVQRAGRTAALGAVLSRRIRATVRGPDWGPYIRRALELRAGVDLGDSGAPLVDRGGRVAGVLFARSENAPRVAYAVDAGALRKVLQVR